MDKKYEIVWRNPEKTVLMIKYLQDVAWEDVLVANSEADALIKELQHDVILIHNTGDYSVNVTDIGSIRKLFYDKKPSLPKNLRFSIVLVNNKMSNASLMVGMETLDKVIRRQKVNHFVNSMEEAERLIKQAGL